MTSRCACQGTIANGAGLQCDRYDCEARRGLGDAALPHAFGFVTGFDLFALPTPATSMTGTTFDAPLVPDLDIAAEFDLSAE